MESSVFEIKGAAPEEPHPFIKDIGPMRLGTHPLFHYRRGKAIIRMMREDLPRTEVPEFLLFTLRRYDRRAVFITNAEGHCDVLGPEALRHSEGRHPLGRGPLR